MQYWINDDTGKVTAREFDDPPFGNLWSEIDQEQYEQLVHPLSRQTTGAGDLATPSEIGADSISKNIAWRDSFTNPPSA